MKEQIIEEEKKLSDKPLIGAILILVIIAGIFIIAINIQKSIQKKIVLENAYNNFPFVESEGKWYTEVDIGGQAYVIPFYYHPRDLEDIKYEPNVEKKLTVNKPEQIYITLDPDLPAIATVAGVQISRITGERYQMMNILTKSAFTRYPGFVSKSPIITCEDSNSKIAVIKMHYGDETSISSEDNCIILTVDEANETVRLAERLTLEMLGIM